MILEESALTTHPLGFITGHKKNDTDINSIIFINDLKYFQHLDFCQQIGINMGIKITDEYFHIVQIKGLKVQKMGNWKEFQNERCEFWLILFHWMDV